MGQLQAASALETGSVAYLPPANVSAPDFRQALAQFASGVTVVTALDAEGRKCGVAATSFSSLSLDPPLIQWSLKKAAWSHAIFADADRFAINILAAGQEDISRIFSTPDIDRFAAAPHHAGLDGLPLIDGALAWLECAAEAQLPGGDHSIFIGRVLRTTTFDKAPLVHWRGGYQRLQDAAS